MAAFISDFISSLVAFMILLAGALAAIAVLGALLIWLDTGPVASLIVLLLVGSVALSLAFAIHEHRKRGGR